MDLGMNEWNLIYLVILISVESKLTLEFKKRDTIPFILIFNNYKPSLI